MSNIGFMESCTISIEKLFNKCMKNSKKNPTKIEKEQYINLIYQFEQMKKFREIEDDKKYKQLMKRLKEADLTRISEFRKKYNKRQNSMGGGNFYTYM